MGRASRKSVPLATSGTKDFVQYFETLRGASKAEIIEKCTKQFGLQKDRSLFKGRGFNVRFSSSNSKSFTNTILALSKLEKIDSEPFLVCLVGKEENSVLLANSTFLKKISHSSKGLRKDNIRGSFNGTDIAREWQGIKNSPENFDTLFQKHKARGFDGNLKRLVLATEKIKPKGKKLLFSPAEKKTILEAPERADEFLRSPGYQKLDSLLSKRLYNYREEILLASKIENTNIRGRAIEYLISSPDAPELAQKLRQGEHLEFITENDLDDYARKIGSFQTATDIKSKLLDSSSNPKAYSIDKALRFMSDPDTVFLFYFVGIKNNVLASSLGSVFDPKLLASAGTQSHWSSANSRGHVQFNGQAISEVLRQPALSIDIPSSQAYLRKLLG